MMIKIRNAALLFSCALLFTGCAAVMAATFVNLFRNDVNIRQTNYAAADYMTQYMKAFVDKDEDRIRAETLQDADQPALNAEIGEIIIDQVGERLHELGYDVDLSAVVTVANKDIYPPAPASGGTPGFVLSGTYLNKGRDIEVRLRLAEISTGQIRAAYDYKLPLNRELRQKAKAEAKIYRVTE
jgi:TolB-like protein